MILNLTVSPDFAPDHISGWYIFNTWLQRQLGTRVHLELYDCFDKQREDIKAGKFDLVYANPFDASMLVRELGFKAVVRPLAKPDETIIATNAESTINNVEDLQPGCQLVATDDPDVNRIGMIMLEPADLDGDNTKLKTVDSYIIVAKHLLNQQADAGFFLKDAYDELSDLIKNQMKVLVSSEISVVHHALLVGPKLQQYIPQIQKFLLNMSSNEKGKGVLESMDLDGWEVMTDEETEFMIDLIDTLID
ncbi:phosphate/phosphite/phosphonate ABC transporter substrate-binding protein [Neptuniibacter caesariensis]|uniref:ABC-type phosphate/phosphonate transport system periplasmic component n=1 Tax=Neptuniibacter caesariensis TaxID=207954 RepID=A0A7U8C347_NEPCE|nr:phosphate/phosphite/phosphonate ABC transporter substrate-binding protein [Neptuniibacter caesariensis]EAR60615.1 ABC-type phosphate/phosphonate transport system periplasmic component [Oceanospirillum sp. MED92] [Neptuniibacter caesariensis]